RLQLLRKRASNGSGPHARDEDVALADVEDTGALDEVITDLGHALERLRTLETERRGVTGNGGPGGRWTTTVAGDAPTRVTAPSAPPVPSLWGSPELLSRLGHDLRSPLNAVLGFAQLLELGELDPDQTDAVRQIIRAGTRLLELINEV